MSNNVNIQTGYPVDLFPHTNERFLCNFCAEVLRDPYQTYCGHRFCYICICHITSKSEVECLYCVKNGISGRRLDRNKIFPDSLIKEEIERLETVCPIKDCYHRGTANDIEEHIVRCKAGSLRCPDCKYLVADSKLTLHKMFICENRNIRCLLCDAVIHFKDQQEHKRICPKALQKCYCCGRKNIRREQMRHHREMECEKRKEKCETDLVRFSKYIHDNFGESILKLITDITFLEQEIKGQDNTLVHGENVKRMEKIIASLQIETQKLKQKIQRSIYRSTHTGIPIQSQTEFLECIMAPLHNDIERCAADFETKKQRLAVNNQDQHVQ